MAEAIIATITDVNFKKPHKRVRAACTLKMFELAQELGYPVITVDNGSPPDYVAEMALRGVAVFPQDKPGMGNAQRQAMQCAYELASPDQAIVWMESEKYPLVPLLDIPVRIRGSGPYDLVMLRRKSLDSYPPEQAMSYQLVALAMKYLTGIDSDFGWGPTILSRNAISYYTNYISQYGDSWDALHCPKLQIIKDGLPWIIAPVDYEHPPEQTAAETGMIMFMKRIQQAEQLTYSIMQEVGRLGLKSRDLQSHQ